MKNINNYVYIVNVLKYINIMKNINNYVYVVNVLKYIDLNSLLNLKYNQWYYIHGHTMPNKTNG